MTDIVEGAEQCLCRDQVKSKAGEGGARTGGAVNSRHTHCQRLDE
jgi:hypothetical protein